MPLEEILRATRKQGDAIVKFALTYHGPAYRAVCRATFDPDERAEWVHAALVDVLEGALGGRFAGVEGDALFDAIRLRVVCFLLERYRERQADTRYGDAPPDALALARHMGIAGAPPLPEDDARTVLQRLKDEQLLAADIRMLLALDRAFRVGKMTPYETEAEEESRTAFTAMLSDDGMPGAGMHRDGSNTRSGRRLRRSLRPAGPARLVETMRRWLLPPAD